MMKELVKARVEGKDANPYLEKMNCLMNDFKELCETLKKRVKDYDYKEKDEEKMKLMDDFVFKVITENI
jgi:hypothetical protein